MINSKSFTLISTKTEIFGLEDIVTVYQECKYCTKIMFLYTKSIPSLNLKYFSVPNRNIPNRNIPNHFNTFKSKSLLLTELDEIKFQFGNKKVAI